MKKQRKIVALSLSVLAGTAPMPMQAQAASDWGYSAPSPPMATSKPPVKNQMTSMLPARSPVVNDTKDKHTQAVESWLELYQLVSVDNELTEQQQKLIQQSLYAKLMTGQGPEVLSILEFWPTIKRMAQLMPAQRDNYKDLFKALLRLELRNAYASRTNLAEKINSELEAIGQILGPERVAVPGEPPLTDSAIQAYADMACFIFEQNHPGRTVDAEDNRTMFANVICDKYRNAPDGPAREAMLNFDLTWAKFKILWTKGTEEDHQQMLAQWNTGAKPATTIAAVKRPPVSDQTLAAVLNNGPWKKILLARIPKPATN